METTPVSAGPVPGERAPASVSIARRSRRAPSLRAGPVDPVRQAVGRSISSDRRPACRRADLELARSR